VIHTQRLLTYPSVGLFVTRITQKTGGFDWNFHGSPD